MHLDPLHTHAGIKATGTCIQGSLISQNDEWASGPVTESWRHCLGVLALSDGHVSSLVIRCSRLELISRRLAVAKGQYVTYVYTQNSRIHIKQKAGQRNITTCKAHNEEECTDHEEWVKTPYLDIHVPIKENAASCRTRSKPRPMVIIHAIAWRSNRATCASASLVYLR